jgi:hemolysin III
VAIEPRRAVILWLVDEARDQQPAKPDPIGAARDTAGGALGAAKGVAGAARGAAGSARDEAGRRLGAAREAAGDRLSSARGSTADRLATAAEAAATMLRGKPKLRGVSHQWAFAISVVAGGALVLAADGGRATLAAGIYALSLSALFGVSALYHRVNWKREDRRLWMRRLDHTMIFVLIAGTYTAFALLVLDGDLARGVLIALWTAAAAGVILNLVWITAPKPVSAAVYVGVGLIAAIPLPELIGRISPVAIGLIVVGGLLYMAGALVYALRRPDPSPAVFGYHEIFHLLVIAAAAAQYAAVAAYALPAG